MDQFVDELPVAIALITADRVTYANLAFRRRCPIVVIDDRWERLFDLEDHATIASALAAARQGQPRRHHVRCAGVPVEAALAPTASGAVALTLEDISLRVILGERLMESEARFQRLVSSAAAPVVAADARGRIVLWNDAATRVFGYSEVDALGEPFAMLFADDRAASYAPERFADDSVPGLGQTLLVRVRRSDGHELPAQLAFASSDFGGTRWFTAVIHDDSERQQLLADLARSEASFRALVEQSPDPVFVSGPEVDDFVIRYVNPTMVALLGYRSGDKLVGRSSVDTFVHPDDRDMLREAHRLHHGGQRMPPIDVRWIRADGAVLDIQVVSRPVQFAEKRATLVFARDVTERNRQERERAGLEDQLRQTQKLEAIGQLAGGIAHDFNNILAVIIANAELALEGLGTHHPVAEDVAEIELAAKRAAALTRQLLAFSRKQRRDPKRVVLDTAIANVQRMLVRIVGEDIVIDARLGAPSGTVEADVGQLDQVLMNLVVNARDAMPSGGRIMIETAPVALGESDAAALGLAAGRYVVLAVTDTGCGMDERVRARIFEPFFTTKEVGKGTGLGLSTVFGIVQQNAGAIGVTSQPGRGTTFRIYLPEVAAAEHGIACEPVPAPSPRCNGTVLLVEDDAQLRAVLRRCLTSWGYALLEAPDGAAALTLARQHQGQIDILLTDVVMPEMDGCALSKHVLAERPQTRVVFMSGHTEHRTVREHTLGAAHVMQKPFTPQELSETMRRAIGA